MDKESEYIKEFKKKLLELKPITVMDQEKKETVDDLAERGIVGQHSNELK